MTTLSFDKEAARRLEIQYAGPDLRRQREATLRALALKAGETVADIGCGPGYLAENMADAVGPSGRVHALDISRDLLDSARRRNHRDWLTYDVGDARALPLPDACADVAVSVQVLEYLADPDQGLREMGRILKPGGRALVMATDWDGVVWYSEHPERMRRVLRAWEAHCADPHLPRTLAPRLAAADFRLDEVLGHAIVNTRLGEDTYSDGIMRLMFNFVRGQGTVPAEELKAWRAELVDLDRAGRYFFGTTRYLFRATRS